LQWVVINILIGAAMFSLEAGIITYLIFCHVSNAVFSIYVHRGIGHQYFTFTPFLAHIFRFWLWFASAHCWPNWQQHYAAKHRKHHKYSDTELDPHSPHHYTIKQLLDVAHNDPNRANYISPEEIKSYAPDVKTVDDWLERNVYSKHQKWGLVLFTLTMTVLFGWPGLIIGLINQFFINASFIIFGNYALHKIGWTYASKNPTDKSRIFCPWGIFCGGEELHAHHHNDTTRNTPWFKRHWWEIDIGWVYASILIKLGLMKRNYPN